MSLAAGWPLRNDQKSSSSWPMLTFINSYSPLRSFLLIFSAISLHRNNTSQTSWQRYCTNTSQTSWQRYCTNTSQTSRQRYCTNTSQTSRQRHRTNTSQTSWQRSILRTHAYTIVRADCNSRKPQSFILTSPLIGS